MSFVMQHGFCHTIPYSTLGTRCVDNAVGPRTNSGVSLIELMATTIAWDAGTPGIKYSGMVEVWGGYRYCGYSDEMLMFIICFSEICLYLNIFCLH